jgi:hypothetical protein
VVRGFLLGIIEVVALEYIVVSLFGMHRSFASTSWTSRPLANRSHSVIFSIDRLFDSIRHAVSHATRISEKLVVWISLVIRNNPVSI